MDRGKVGIVSTDTRYMCRTEFDTIDISVGLKRCFGENAAV